MDIFPQPTRGQHRDNTGNCRVLPPEIDAKTSRHIPSHSGFCPSWVVLGR